MYFYKLLLIKLKLAEKKIKQEELTCKAHYKKFAAETGETLVLKAIPDLEEKQCVLTYIVPDASKYAVGFDSVDKCVKTCFRKFK